MGQAQKREALKAKGVHHRFQVDAAASALGGLDYIYAMRGDDRVPVAPVPASQQRAALMALLATLDPAELARRLAEDRRAAHDEASS